MKALIYLINIVYSDFTIDKKEVQECLLNSKDPIDFIKSIEGLL